MADDWDRQGDIAAEGQRAALYYAKQDRADDRQPTVETAETETVIAWQRSELARLQAQVASLNLTLGGRTFSATVPEPIGCPVPGACAQVAEIGRLRAELATARRVAFLEAAELVCEEATGTQAAATLREVAAEQRG